MENGGFTQNIESVKFLFQQKAQQQQVVETIVPKDPPPQFEYISDPPTISAIDLLVPEPLVLF